MFLEEITIGQHEPLATGYDMKVDLTPQCKVLEG